MDELVLYKTDTRMIKLSRFFGLVDLLNDAKLWGEVKKQAECGMSDLRVEVDTILLNAVKLAINGAIAARTGGTSELAKTTILCSDIREAGEKDRKENDQQERDRARADQEAERDRQEREKKQQERDATQGH